MANYPPSCPPTLTTTQFFSRTGLGFLWNKRNDLDPGQVSIINSLYMNRKKGQIECQQTVTYKLARTKAGQLGYGRYYGTKGSLETLERECRGTICRDYYHDVDIANCHPVLLSQYAQRYSKDLPELDRYIQNREAVLASISPSREEAKEEVIRILYGGTNKHETTAPLSHEIRTFSKFLATQDEHAKLLAAVKHEDNVYGKFLSYILQTEERSCMLAMKKSLEDQGWCVDVLAYDGVMVRKRTDADIISAMSVATAAIKAETGYDVSLVSKAFSYFEVPTIDEEISKGVSRSAFEEMKAEFEKNHFYYYPGNDYVEVKEDGEILFLKHEHAVPHFASKWCFKHSDKFGDNTPFFPLWLKDTSRRSIRKIDMAPSDDPEVYSPPLRWCFQSFAPVEDREPYVTLFLTFLKSLIKEDNLRAFVIEWLAQMFQQPFKNSNACVILTGMGPNGMGCGKDVLGNFIGKWLVGRQYFTNYTSTEQFWDKHDQGRLNKIFIKLEEANGRLNRKYEDQFKSIITSENVMVNPKGRTAVEAPNYNRYFQTTNEIAPVKLDQGDRRFVLISCASGLRTNPELRSQVFDMLYTPQGARAVGDWLMEQTFAPFPRAELPRSQHMTEVIEEEKSVEQRFFESGEWEGEETAASDLYTIYKNWCVAQSLPYSRSAKAFGMKLLPLLTIGNLKKDSRREGAFYSLE